MGQDTTITILGETYTVKPPALYAIVEEVTYAMQSAVEEGQYRRVLGAAILLGVPALLKRSKLDYNRAGFSVLNFGGAAYSWLRSQGATAEEVIEAGFAAIEVYKGTLIDMSAVKDRASFTPPHAVE